MPIFWQKFISFLIVERATSCGVVTMIAPSGFALSNSLITVKCSSDVPGGVSVEENILFSGLNVYFKSGITLHHNW